MSHADMSAPSSLGTADAQGSKMHFAGSLRLALRLALRELRGGLGGFYIFVACVALGVASIASVGTLAGALTNGITNQGQVLLGGDIAASLVHRRADEKIRSFLGAKGQLSEVVTMRAMARKLDGSAQVLVHMKAVDGAYPLYGAVRLEGESAQAKKDQQNSEKFKAALAAPNSVVMAPLALERLKLKVGDKIRIGAAELTIGGTLAFEPDQLSGRPGFAPRALMSIKTLMQTGLAEPGSLMNWHYRLRLDDNSGILQTRQDDNAKLKELEEEIKARFPQAGFSFTNRGNPSPRVSGAINRLSQFLTLVGLTVLLVGGVGVANAVASFLDKKRKTIAAYKCLGASHNLVLQVYLIQVLIIAALGVAIGLVVGAFAPMLAGMALKGALPFELDIGFQGGALLSAAFSGFFVALIFMLWPLGRTRMVRPQLLLRNDVSDEAGPRPPWRFVVLVAVLTLLLAGFAIYSSDAKLIALYFCAGVAALFAIFVMLGTAIRWAAQRMPRPKSGSKSAEMVIALANLSGPANLTRSITLSLGLGLTLLATVALVDRALVAGLQTSLPANAPSYFFLDIDRQDFEGFERKLREIAPTGKTAQAPMLRGRIVSLAGRKASEIKAPPNAQWVLNGDRGLTFAKTLPEGSQLVEGKWWGADYQGENLVSFEAELGHALGLSIGDKITVNILGRDVSAKIANFRTVKWESLSINFVMVFSPNTLAAAPYNYLATLALPKDTPLEIEAGVLQKVSVAYPSVTTIRVRDAVEAVGSVFARVMMAIRGAGMVTLIAGALVLAGALATAHRRRIYEAVIFKTLGATRRRILWAHLLEYGLLALLTAAGAVILAIIASWLIVTQIMDLPYQFFPIAGVQAAVLAVVLVGLFGGIGSWRALSVKTARMIRDSS